MKTMNLKKMFFGLVAMMIFLPNFAYADCSDSTHTCSSTDEKIIYGNCSQSALHLWKCKPCDKHDWNKECNAFERTTWMKDTTVANRRLVDTVLPGAHDAGMGIANSCTDYAFNDITQTQTKSIYELLMSGIRVFDIRPTINKNGNMRTAHISWIGKDIDIGIKILTLRNEGCYGYSMEEVLKDVAKFKNDFPSELIVLELTHFQNFQKYDTQNSHFDSKDFKEMKTMINHHLGEFMIKGVKNPLNSTVKNLVQKGGVLIFMDTSTDLSKGYYSYKDLRVEGSYANAQSVEKMVTDQLKKLNNRTSDSFFMTSWTLTMDKDMVVECAKKHFSKGLIGSCTSILSLASQAFPSISKLEENKIQPNVIYMDASNYHLTDVAIRMNR